MMPVAANEKSGLRSAVLPGLLFLVSGFSALIYQSIWTQYLGLLLGHAAYAQTLVLVMFMGGMALGSWLVSRFTLHIRRLIAAYAVAELLLALAGFGFHPLFVAYSALNQDLILPALQGSAWSAPWQWLSAGALIAPQTLLLGATFPLMASGLLRLQQLRDGEVLGQLYFTNGLGASIGVLCATFVLLPLGGLPGALQVAAAMNALLALGAWALSRHLREAEHPPLRAGAASGDADDAALKRLRRVLLAATFLSSAASFGYEIGWVRLLNQALGTTLHGFELMLAAFILGIALGGLWVRRHADQVDDVVRYAGVVQVLMGSCALLSVPLLARSFDGVAWLMAALAPSMQGYTLYSAATALIALAVMLPAAFFAGMTLPLFTAALLRRGAGERAIGQVYAANTLGAILGVLIVVHGLIPLMGISLSLVVAASADVLIGVALLRGVSPKRWSPAVIALSLAAFALLIAVIRVGLPDQARQSSGVFRHGKADGGDSKLAYYRDGATASVAVRTTTQHAFIATNGKPDAGLSRMDQTPTNDEITMVMLGALPLALHSNPERVALIGWGSGLSTHVVLGSTVPKQVDTIEIERAMWQGAKFFHARNHRAYEDRRSKVHFEDARRFLASGVPAYDVIVSEPSNPWVSGVASLFTQEFYAIARRHLKPDGLLVQWIHVYEMSDELLAEMLAALLKEFPRSEFYLTNDADLIVVGARDRLPSLHDAPWRQPDLSPELRRVGLSSVADLQVRRIGGAAALRSFVRLHNPRPHSDFHPTVALAAPQARFLRRLAVGLLRPQNQGVPLLRVLECREPVPARAGVVDGSAGQLTHQYLEAMAAVDAMVDGASLQTLFQRNTSLAETVSMLRAMRAKAIPFDAAALHVQLGVLSNMVLSNIEAPLQQRLWGVADWRRDLPALTPALASQLALYGDFAAGRWREAEAQATTLLGDASAPLSAPLRERILLLGMLSGMAQGETGVVASWQQRHADVSRGPAAGLRDFLAAWEQGGEPVCAAAQRESAIATASTP